MASGYLVSRRYDFSFFLIPPFLSVIVAVGIACFLDLQNQESQLVSVIIFVTMVMAIDVAHVHATLFRVYFDRVEFRRRRLLYAGLPILVFLVSIFVYQFGELVYWRIFAYLAVIHFIRQQYGFVALYNYKKTHVLGSRQSPFILKHQVRLFQMDKIAIYVATLYPLIYWHLNLPRNFYWFMEGDFIAGIPKIFLPAFTGIYFIFITCYVFLRIYLIFVHKNTNLGKDMTMAATFLTWYIGIVVYDLDLVFTITNVVIHGVAYIALVRFVARENPRYQANPFWRKIISNGFYFFLLLILLAFLEEFLWDNLVWFDHPQIFGGLFKASSDLDFLAQLLVPLFSVPQITHYLLDGFIWKFQEQKNPGLKKILIG